MTDCTNVILYEWTAPTSFFYLTQTILHVSGFQVQYKKEYEKNKAQSDYNTLPATENPLLRQLRYAGTILSDVGI